MKKIVLLVASILATLHSVASHSSNDSNNPLILSPSDGIINHGSHYSHKSHSSHYSTAFSIQHDSVCNVTPDIIKIAEEGINSMYENYVNRESSTTLFRLKNAGTITTKQQKKIAKSLKKQAIIIEIVLSRIYISSHNEIIKSFNNEVIIHMNPEDKCLFISYVVKGVSRDFTEFPLGGGKMVIPLSSENTTFYQINQNNCVIDNKRDWMYKITQNLTIL